MTRYSVYTFLDEVRVLSLTPLQYLTVMNAVRVYFEYRRNFDKAQTPEGVALSRWGMDDAERDYEKLGREFNVQLPSLFKLRHAVY